MRNKIFQWLWFRIIKYLIPASKGVLIPKNQNRLIWKLRIAKLFGPIHGILIGDSNSAIFDTYDCMHRFQSLTVSLGVPGTTAGDWLVFFKTQKGKKFYDKLVIIDNIIWNIGGNYSLRGLMKKSHAELTQLWKIFPISWNCLIPPVHAGMLATISESGESPRSADDWKADFIILREYIRQIWKPFVIDLFTPFIDPQTGEATIIYLRDAVHFSKIAVNIIQKVFNKIT